MSGRIVAKPEPGHACAPGWATYTTGPEAEPFGAGTWASPPNEADYPKGTVWECDCGRTYVSLGSITPGDRTPRWRKERRRERRRREAGHG